MNKVISFIRSLSIPTKMIALAAFVLVAAGLVAQQQQSGGVTISAVSITGALPTGSNVIGSVNLNNSIPAGSNVIGAISNTGFNINGSLPTGSNTIGAISNTGFSINGSLPAGSNVLGYSRVVNASTCGTTEYDSGMTYLPVSSTAITSTATCAQSVILNNTDTVPHNVTVTDQSTACASGPCTILGPAYVIPALSQVRVPLEGAKLTGGIKWSTDTASKVVGVIRGNQ